MNVLGLPIVSEFEELEREEEEERIALQQQRIHKRLASLGRGAPKLTKDERKTEFTKFEDFNKHEQAAPSAQKPEGDDGKFKKGTTGVGRGTPNWWRDGRRKDDDAGVTGGLTNGPGRSASNRGLIPNSSWMVTRNQGKDDKVRFNNNKDFDHQRASKHEGKGGGKRNHDQVFDRRVSKHQGGSTITAVPERNQHQGVHRTHWRASEDAAGGGKFDTTKKQTQSFDRRRTPNNNDTAIWNQCFYNDKSSNENKKRKEKDEDHDNDMFKHKPFVLCPRKDAEEEKNRQAVIAALALLTPTRGILKTLDGKESPGNSDMTTQPLKNPKIRFKLTNEQEEKEKEDRPYRAYFEERHKAKKKKKREMSKASKTPGPEASHQDQNLPDAEQLLREYMTGCRAIDHASIWNRRIEKFNQFYGSLKNSKGVSKAEEDEEDEIILCRPSGWRLLSKFEYLDRFGRLMDIQPRFCY